MKEMNSRDFKMKRGSLWYILPVCLRNVSTCMSYDKMVAKLNGNNIDIWENLMKIAE